MREGPEPSIIFGSMVKKKSPTPPPGFNLGTFTDQGKVSTPTFSTGRMRHGVAATGTKRSSMNCMLGPFQKRELSPRSESDSTILQDRRFFLGAECGFLFSRCGKRGA